MYLCIAHPLNGIRIIAAPQPAPKCTSKFCFLLLVPDDTPYPKLLNEHCYFQLNMLPAPISFFWKVTLIFVLTLFYPISILLPTATEFKCSVPWNFDWHSSRTFFTAWFDYLVLPVLLALFRILWGQGTVPYQSHCCYHCDSWIFILICWLKGKLNQNFMSPVGLC